MSYLGANQDKELFYSRSPLYTAIVSSLLQHPTFTRHRCLDEKNFSIHPEILTVHDVDGARILASMTSISRMTGNGISSIQDSNWQNQLNVRCEGACILFFPSLTIHLRAQNSLPWFCTNFQAPTKIGQQLGGTSQPTSPKTGQHSSSSAHSTMAHHYELWVIQLKQ